MKASRVGITAAALALLFTLTGCESKLSQSSTPQPVLASQSSSVVGDGRLQPGEQCDDGNTASGDGCSATGAIEAGYLCHVPGRACSLASLCGNNVANPGEACDDGDTAVGANGCSATCDLSLCGNGVFNNREWPNFDQEICDDGNRFEGDGCSRQCEVEPGFACAGSPSRCVRAGVAVFNTGVDENNRRLETGADPHWFYTGTTTGAATGGRTANDWPQEIQTARFMAAPLGSDTCVYQDFMVPSTTNIAQFRLRLATFNDNEFTTARVNGVTFMPVTISEPQGSPWQKNIIREFGTGAAWRPGLNRIELCNENSTSAPNAFRYLFVDAYDDRCGDGAISPREECDDGDATSGDGCSASCGIEAGYGCTGTPSTCAATCGNGLLNPGEQCDDGNTAANDGCNASCRVEPGNACPIPGQPCTLSCGNGTINDGEQCDDGNDNDSDGCSAACRIERGYECSGAPSTCNALCGNSRLDSGEQCDDGNANLNDGCSIACTLELGYACPTPGQACVETCGNGTVNPGEQCDDGNLQSLDGCGTDCRVEPGYACSAPQSGPSVCVESCGNRVVDLNETCDDGNRQSADGCSSGCRVETGYSCSGQPSACITLCGDGIKAGGERCDDGNTVADDGCAANCQVESGYACTTSQGGTSVCVQSCGNGSVEVGEDCDDDDTTSGDGCANVCVVEPGYTCSGAPSVCRTTCGDGIVAGTEVCDDGDLSGGNCSPRCLWENGQSCMASGVCESGYCNPTNDTCASANACGNGRLDEAEQCDDGNTTAGDGCDTACTIEAGYDCSGNPSACAVTCGDGIKAASEACDDGNTTAGDGCGATCTVEGGFGCQNTGVRTFFTRLGRDECTQVADFANPSLPAGTAQAALTVPGRYRMQYVSGAASYAGTSSWFPGIFGITANAGTGVQGFTLGNVPEGGPASATRDAAMELGFPLGRTFDAATGDVRLALVDTNCDAGDNTNTAVTYRVDALSICQLVPVLTSPAPGGTSGGTLGGTASPGTTVHVYLDGGTTPVCTVTADASGNWTCDLGDVEEGPHSVVLTSTLLSATETAPSVDFTIGTEPPPAAPVITGPTPGSVLSDSTPTLSGTAVPGSTVTVREGATVLCTATASDTGQWSCVPATPLADGAHSVTGHRHHRRRARAPSPPRTPSPSTPRRPTRPSSATRPPSPRRAPRSSSTTRPRTVCATSAASMAGTTSPARTPTPSPRVSTRCVSAPWMPRATWTRPPPSTRGR
ncbi:DUF4215 domain-containing protein [Pyxidicoccus sp. 3LG]